VNARRSDADRQEWDLALPPRQPKLRTMSGVSRSRSVLIAGVLAVALSGTASGSARSAFHTPQWFAQCYVVGEERPPTLTCLVTHSGFFVSMNAHTRTQTGVNPRDKNRHDPFAASRVLGPDHYWEFGHLFGCVSRDSGLKCWNAAGHGWWLGRSGSYRLF
jgi:hypothetical protein